MDSTSMTVLTQSLLTDKNTEIDDLTAEIARLSTELEQLRATEPQQPLAAPLFVEVASLFFIPVQCFLLLRLECGCGFSFLLVLF